MRYTSASASIGKGDLIHCNVYDYDLPILRIGDVAVYLDDDLDAEGMVSVALAISRSAAEFADAVVAHIEKECDAARAVISSTEFLKDSRETSQEVRYAQETVYTAQEAAGVQRQRQG
jgi:hypothetical protein